MHEYLVAAEMQTDPRFVLLAVLRAVANYIVGEAIDSSEEGPGEDMDDLLYQTAKDLAHELNEFVARL